ncbi:hypothetical protein HMPREF9952_1402 [Haemophilus pittmaniae HK 85]|uniref:Uncharacterized protein n=1 Tax=Haemophilus pittmaniae HK 85 TaxID=1035188 RepID=F9QB57_9PAST|nr:hypothetical protein HMPREF9952_1402 [Haemophilus pittmaniae HK 85]
MPLNWIPPTQHKTACPPRKVSYYAGVFLTTRAPMSEQTFILGKDAALEDSIANFQQN